MDAIELMQEINEYAEAVRDMVIDDLDEKMEITWDGTVRNVCGNLWVELIGDYTFFAALTTEKEIITILELEEASDFM